MDTQRALNGGRATPLSEHAARAAGPRVRTTSAFGVEPDGTPKALAAMLLGSLAILVALRLAGVRFSFGANIGGGGS